MMYTLGSVAFVVAPALGAWAFFQHGGTQLRLYLASALMIGLGALFLVGGKYMEVRERRRYTRPRESLSYSSAR